MTPDTTLPIMTSGGGITSETRKEIPAAKPSPFYFSSNLKVRELQLSGAGGGDTGRLLGCWVPGVVWAPTNP